MKKSPHNSNNLNPNPNLYHNHSQKKKNTALGVDKLITGLITVVIMVVIMVVLTCGSRWSPVSLRRWVSICKVKTQSVERDTAMADLAGLTTNNKGLLL
jgi:hypothetical protein